MPVTHSRSKARRTGLDSLAPLSNRLGAYEKESRPAPPNRGGNNTRVAEVYTSLRGLPQRAWLSIEAGSNLGELL